MSLFNSFAFLTPSLPPPSLRTGMHSGTLTEAGQVYSESLAQFLQYEQQTDLTARGKEILVLTGEPAYEYRPQRCRW